MVLNPHAHPGSSAPQSQLKLVSLQSFTPLTHTSMADPVAVGTRRDAAPFKLPDIPKEFGQDNGEFYRHYDALAEELDENMVKSQKEQLDGLLLFAGLFAGVNSTFLALTLPLLSASPADDTNALLRENNAILLQLALNRNESFPIPSPLPSESFSVSGRALTVNILFSISLTFALMSSLFAVLGRQWLVDYRSRSGSGDDNQRRERISRYLGARGWGLEWLLGDLLPTLLQIGLILFGISLTIYTSTLNPTVAKIVGAFLGTGMAFLVCIGIFAIWDPYCPLQTPLSRMITHLTPVALQLTITVVGLVAFVAFAAICAVFVAACPATVALAPLYWIGVAVYYMVGMPYRQSIIAVPWFIVDQQRRTFRFLIRSRFPPRIAPLVQYGKRMGVSLTTLQAEAVARVISYSDDRSAFAHAISNLLSVKDIRILQRLANNDQF
ncbi:hypothetical protein FRC05_006385, partial [Tulasnella sp. 425]